MKKVSIIIPNYNGEEYIGRCIESVLSQDYPEKEVIVVDDGSTDKSVDIAKNADCVKVHSVKHLGVNAARKLGLQKSNGDYIMFVDADDFLKSGAIKTLVEKMEKYDVDVIRFNAEYYPDGGIVMPIANVEDNNIIEHDEIISLLVTGYKLNSLWGKIYKRELLDGNPSFNYDLSLGEDLLINVEACKDLDKMLAIDDSFYYYRMNNKSLTRSRERWRVTQNIKDRLFVTCEMLRFVSENVSDNETKQIAIYEQLKAVWEVMKRLALIDDYKKEDFEADFKDCIAQLGLSEDDEKKLNCYVAKMGVLEKLKNGLPVKAIGKKDSNVVWKNFCRYRFLRKIIKRVE